MNYESNLCTSYHSCLEEVTCTERNMKNKAFYHFCFIYQIDPCLLFLVHTKIGFDKHRHLKTFTPRYVRKSFLQLSSYILVFNVCICDTRTTIVGQSIFFFCKTFLRKYQTEGQVVFYQMFLLI